MVDEAHGPALADLARCFAGAVPAVLVTASAAGIPNVTYLSRAHFVDDERIALSNQFMSKSSRNVAENPRASLLLLDPVNHDEYRLALTFERTERRGRVFDALRGDVDALASLIGMQDVFRLRSADVFRVRSIEQVPPHPDHLEPPVGARRPAPDALAPRLGELCGRLGRCADLDAVVTATVAGLDELLGYPHSILALVDETGERLFTIASHGYRDEGVGSEVAVGDGILGSAASRCAPVRIGNQLQMTKYARSVRRSFEAAAGGAAGREVPLPGLALAESRLAVPALALGQLVAVLQVEDERPAAFNEVDEANLTVVASVLATAVEAARSEERLAEAEGRRAAPAPVPSAAPPSATTQVRFFAVDGSTFLDGDYLIKGVAGRILWSLLRQRAAEGRIEFTNREVRLDPTLDLPDFRDNFESRLILLKRRLDERDAPIRIVKTGRGRFRLDVDAELRLDEQ